MSARPMCPVHQIPGAGGEPVATPHLGCPSCQSWRPFTPATTTIPTARLTEWAGLLRQLSVHVPLEGPARDQALEAAQLMQWWARGDNAVGICGHNGPTLNGSSLGPVCELPAGHDGWHQTNSGTKWTLWTRQETRDA